MKRALTLLPAVALLLSACGSDDDGGTSVEGAWARASAEGQTTGAIYFEITADAADTLVAASVPASVAGRAEIHEVVPAEMGDDTGDGEHEMGDGGGEMAMVMQELEGGLALPAGETVTLEPGGYHVMLLDLTEPLEVGDEIELTLDFATADDATLTVEVAESAP